ncbi:MAG: MFS transporter [Anaerolineae bacterium]|nr:MFS transporter [Anaerolineae bacterium]
MKKQLKWFDFFTININYLALTTRSQVLAPLIIPVLVQQFVGESSKGTAVGTIRLWALMAALLAQALFGIISDQTRHKFGRRRPFIFWGSLSEVVVFIAVGITAGAFSGMTGYAVLFALYIFSMLTSNMGHAATQGLIPDLVPDEKRGFASGIKALFELPFPVILVSFLMAPMVSSGNIWGAIIATIVVLVVCMGLTMLVPEEKCDAPKEPTDWKPFINLVLMTALFTVTILGMGELVKFFSAATERIGGHLLNGLAGVVGMCVSVVIGVWISIRVGLGFKEASAQPRYTWWVINRLAYMVALTNLSTFMIYFFQEKFGFAGEEAAGPAARVMMLVGVFVLILAVPTGWLADRVGKKMLLVISGLVSAIGVAVIVFIPNMTAVYIGAFLVGAATGVFYSANWALGTEIIPNDQAGKYLGIQNLAGAGAGAIGAYLGGPIGDSSGYTILFGIYAFMFLLSAIALIGIKETKSNRGDVLGV